MFVKILFIQFFLKYNNNTYVFNYIPNPEIKKISLHKKQ